MQSLKYVWFLTNFILLLGVKTTINKDILEKYEKIFVKTFEKGKDNYLNEVYGKSMFYAFRVIIDNKHSAIKLNDRLREYMKNYWKDISQFPWKLNLAFYIKKHHRF